MSKVVVIGIDGMDSELIDRFQNYMPTFKKIKDTRPKIQMKSIFPPDSTPAWASIYTGLSPASHGIINFINIADKLGGYKPFEVRDEYFQGKTFWDIASKYNKKVCIVLPFNIYPGWPVNGKIVCRINKLAKKDYPLSAFPEITLRKYPHKSRDFNLIQGFISKNQLPFLIKSCKRRTLAEADLGLKMLQSEDWDLFFIFFSSLDGIQHYFWNYFDETHPNYQEKNPYQDVIREFYILIDEIVGRFVNSVDHGIPIIILSDHGHGIRPFKLLNMNEVLRREGILVSKTNKYKSVNPFYSSKWLKQRLMNFVKYYGAGYFLMKFSQRFPIWKKFLAPSSAIDWGKTLAYVSDLSTVKSYSYGGIRINKNIENIDYEILTDKILNIIFKIQDPETSEMLVNWALRREGLYRGPYIEKYPEIVLKLKEGYGLGWEVNGPLFSIGDIHNIQPGSHKMDTPVFFIVNSKGKKCFRDEITLIDVAPTIIDLLGVEEKPIFDGKSIFEAG